MATTEEVIKHLKVKWCDKKPFCSYLQCMSNVCEDQVFQGLDFVKDPPAFKEFEYCRFHHCHFAKANLSDFRFVACIFQDCDLSNAKLASTTLNDVRFTDCKLLGLHFENCSDFLFSVSFQNSVLNYSSFYNRQLKKTVFTDTILHEVDFTNANLSGAVFDKCDLNKAIFEGTNLEQADFRTAFNYAIDPEKNYIKKAKFDRNGLAGLLGKYGIQIT